MSVNHAGSPLTSPARLTLTGKTLRSILLRHGDDRAWHGTAMACAADAVLIDLAECDDDGIGDARQRTIDFAAHRSERESARQKFLIGIHGMEDDDRARADLVAQLPLRPDGVVITANSGAQIQKLDVMLSVEEIVHGQTAGETDIVALCGNAMGVLAAQSFARKSPRLKALVFDAPSLARSLGARHVANADGGWSYALATARSLMLLGARAASVAAVDFAPPGLLGEALRAACAQSLADGYGAMLTGDPAQLETINAVFRLPAGG